MNKTIYPSKYQRVVKAPSSKSYMQRAIAIALLADGETQISNADFSNDSMSILKVAEQLGAEVHISGDQVCILGKRDFKGKTLSAGESGLGIRTFTPIAALFPQTIKLTGEGSLLKRPINMVETPLRDLGVTVESHNGYLPLTVSGPLKGGVAEVDGSISSQVLTGLLIALPMAENDSLLKVNKLQSIPYIDMTLDILKAFGAQVEQENYETFKIKGSQKYKARNYKIEGDWSGAAFHLVAGAIAGEVDVKGLNPQSLQADRALLDALEKSGAKVEISEESIKISKAPLQAFDFDATHCPDLFPPLVVLAAACKGETRITGVTRLYHKESNRALVLQQEMGKLGIKIKLDGDVMIIKGGEISGGKIHSNNDHRIAMAGAIAALIASGPIEIEHAEAINKSYPGFFEDLGSSTPLAGRRT
ncbi:MULTISPECIES: 3-phosphoshikimate 1-carboxyvinyltransferase [unclassified Lentimicrobium]|uniref:3-phosphoshikimate 1-carboxyvinyltransferase n=1 Tax=unclassified Lentimicrobium TaxID=2677434 RepID=UPI0015566228|nr:MULTISPECIES: 3-phosphoshikimate 1-carboxyvinyltransferase [unclassified Lentimicrobium]NPD45376.1 3-phosphoshikimate 1-carboxyvinyltransferase [Lentimicrobium sp. S6]NPD85257.1 3-phosphoshikimate 1-carboxyvinyltransferase [Lentimicrobium sp. L6]